MTKEIRKLSLLLLVLLMASLCLTGCKPSRKKVENSSYYKELLSKYEKLKEKNEELKKKEENQEQLSDDETRAEKYLAKIERDELVRLEVGYADIMDDSDYIDHKEVYRLATQLAANADRTTKYTPETLEKSFDKVYGYVLYDENNAIYEITVYEGNYIVFSDLPKYVYYCPDADALGKAFLAYREDYPSSNLLHRIADTSLMISSGGICYENDVCLSIANAIDKMDKKESNRQKAEKKWKEIAKKKGKSTETGYVPDSVVYTFYNHGNTMSLTMYDQYIRLENINGSATWYKVSKDDIKKIKSIVKAAHEALKKTEKDSADDTDKNEKSHTKEIEEESAISADN